MSIAPREPLHLESLQDDRVVVLGCETCGVTHELRTGDGMFAAAVQAFFSCHASCVATIDLT